MSARLDHIPPQWMDRLLQWFCDDVVVETLQGDLHELYTRRRTSKGKFKADLFYFFDVLDSCRPFAFKRRSKSNYSNGIAMYCNYFKVAWRNLFKHKAHAAIKVGGFAIGITAFLLISLFVWEEYSYDRFYDNTDRIYRMYNVYNHPADFASSAEFPPQVAQVIRDHFPEVEKVGRLLPHHGWWDAGDNQFRPADQLQNSFEKGFAYLDQEVLEILEIPMVYGQREYALSRPNSLVISKSKADKYFPNEDPTGKTVILNDDEETPFVIGGVMEDLPSNMHLQFDFFITLTAREFWPGEQTNWCCWNYTPYLRLRPGTDPKVLEEKLSIIRDNYIVRHAEERGSAEAEDIKKYYSFKLQPVADIHLYSQEISTSGQQGDIDIVVMFMVIAAFILLLAIINFVNLSTAKSANRAKEVGLRKVVGSLRNHLVQQFITESILFGMLSLGLGLLLAGLLLPFFNELADKQLILPLAEWWVVPFLLVFVLFISLMAGLYPAFYLSSFRPMEVLSGSLSRGSKGSRLRSALVIFQFTSSMVLLAGAFIVDRQIDFMLNKKLGYEKDRVLMIEGANTLQERQEAFKEELIGMAGIANVTISDYMPVSHTTRNGNLFWKEGRSKIDVGLYSQRWHVDKDFIETLGMKLVAGRGFSERASDSLAIIINQTMARKLGLENPVGARIHNRKVRTVIGVVEDFHFESMKEEIYPLALTLSDYPGSIVAVKLKSDDLISSMETITAQWEAFMPDQSIRYTFLDEAYSRMYEDVLRTRNIFTVFAALAVIVASLGLFGLSAFMVEQRNKEISIRKVLGASFATIFRLLTLNFLKLVGISLLIAIPLGWLLMNEWLANFKYSTSIHWGIFAAAGLMVSSIAMVTVSYESIKAAVVNPVKGLRMD